MTHLCTILPFRHPSAAQVQAVTGDEIGADQRATLHHIHEAEDVLEHLTLSVRIAGTNAEAGTLRAGLGSAYDGRAIAWCCRLIISLSALRGNKPADHALTHAAEQWLQARGKKS